MTHEHSQHNVPIPPEVPRPPSKDAKAVLRKKKAKQRVIVLAAALVVLATAFWYFQKSLSLPLQSIASLGTSFETSVGEQSSSTNNFSAPPPFVAVSKGAAKKTNTLTDEGVITNTNIQRAQNGNLPPLAENPTLDDIAMLRINDLFQHQYFAHVNSSTGESAVTVASSVGYSYLALGENLALGNYAGDAGVVTAWMNSPGHRANILNTHYTQIGVAVQEGMFEGQETWIAVQVFGRPSSDCPAPDANLETSITLSQNQITTMAAQLQTDKAAIAAMDPQSGPQYNAQVEDYNNLAAQYNNLSMQTTAAISQYNAQVNTFNTCLQE
jgi:uncharacterized protein YkwD